MSRVCAFLKCGCCCYCRGGGGGGGVVVVLEKCSGGGGGGPGDGGDDDDDATNHNSQQYISVKHDHHNLHLPLSSTIISSGSRSKVETDLTKMMQYITYQGITTVIGQLPIKTDAGIHTCNLPRLLTHSD